ncbi:MAG TPA: FAD-dependent oxidoreductase [Draconibacterium sp.]|nr:FAD-dependent oxidoreductase [Draconibacterium sp.]
MKQVDFLIIGQGLAGTLLAFEMLDRGMSFHLVSSPNKSRASLVAAGMVNPLVFKRLTKSWMVDELLPVMKNRYRELEKLLQENFYFEKNILKPLSSQELLLWEEKKADSGYQDYIYKISENAVIDGISNAGSFGEVSGSGYLNLSAFLQRVESYFLEKELLTEATINYSDLTNEKGQFHIGEISADKIVFCEGYHLHQNPLFRFVKMNPAKGEVLLIHAPSLSEEYILNKQVFVLPVGEHRFKVGSTYEWDDLSESPTQQGKELILHRLENLIKVDYSIEDHLAGVRPTISDRRPVMGAHPKYPNIFVFNGLGTKGVMLAPRFAREMCMYLMDENDGLRGEINVNRFI